MALEAEVYTYKSEVERHGGISRTLQVQLMGELSGHHTAVSRVTQHVHVRAWSDREKERAAATTRRKP
jgi:hypothetical protein